MLQVNITNYTQCKTVLLKGYCNDVVI